MKTNYKLSVAVSFILLLCVFFVSCDNTVSEEKGDTKEDKIVEIDKTGAKYGVIIEFNPEDIDKISLSKIEDFLKSMSIQPKDVGIYTFKGDHVILNSELLRLED